MAVVYQKTGSATASGGAWSVVIPFSGTHGICKQLSIKPNTGTTTFDVTLTVSDVVLFHATSLTGLLNELVEIPITADATLAVANSSVDEAFTYLVSTVNEL